MKRFYKQAAAVTHQEQWAVELDGKPMRSPGGKRLLVPTLALAEAIAQEWQDQPEDLSPESMTLTRLTNTALDHVHGARAAVIDEICTFLDGDQVCYRVDIPADLRTFQDQFYAPYVQWFEHRFDASLTLTTGLTGITQGDYVNTAVRRYLTILHDFQLTAVQEMVGILSSVILMLALVEKQAGPEDVFSVSRTEDRWQEQQWGVPEEKQQKIDADEADFNAAWQFFQLASALAADS